MLMNGDKAVLIQCRVVTRCCHEENNKNKCQDTVKFDQSFVKDSQKRTVDSWPASEMLSYASITLCTFFENRSVPTQTETSLAGPDTT